MAYSPLYIGTTESKGRGIFTYDAIPADTVVELAPVLVMSDEDRKILDQTLLHDYIFEWQPEGQKLCIMALGWIPLYNHSYQSNCEYFMNYEEQSMYIQTVRDIEPGEELTINYNGDLNESAKVWFDAK